MSAPATADMQTIAVYNLKGGVGKTAAAVNLAWLAARDGLRTLLWDLDPQAAATFYFRIDAHVDGGAERLLAHRRDLTRAIKATDYPLLDLVPADFSYRHLDVDLEASGKPLKRLRKLLAPVAGEGYDLVLLDCAPSISLVSESVFHAADALLVPLIPTPLSLRAYDQVAGFLRNGDGPSPELMPFFSMVDRRRLLHRQVVTEFMRAHPELLRIYIPYAAEVERMGTHRAPLGVFAPSSGPAQAFAALWQAVKARRLPAAVAAPASGTG